MEQRAYDELYLPLSQRVMGDMYDYAVNTLKIPIEKYHELFIVSGIVHQIEIGNPSYVAGKNGCEVAREVISICTDKSVDEEDIMYVDKSPEYWIGWALSFYQWHSNRSFKEINSLIPIESMYGMYSTLHESDISLFVEIMDEKCNIPADSGTLKRLRQYANLSQRALSEKSGVPLRQIQLFEQGQRDISKTQGRTLFQLSKTLGCSIEELVLNR